MEHNHDLRCSDLRALVAERLPVGALVVDIEERIQWANIEIARLLGYEPSDLVGSNLTRLFETSPASESPDTGRSSPMVSANQQTTPVRARHKNGSTFAADIMATPIEYHGVELMSVTLWNATERRRMEQDFEAFHRQNNVINRLEAAQFLAGSILHDFNNILTAIHGHAERALEGSDRLEVRDALESVLQASGRATTLIARLSGTRRSDPVSAPKERVLTQFTSVAHEALGLLRGALPSRIRMEWFLHPSTPKVAATDTDLHQLVMNLGINAAEAMSAHGGLLRVTLEPESTSQRETSPRKYVKLCVSDTGHGMDAATLERAFEPFFSTKAREGSGGLGLSVVRQIVERLGGTISVETAPGKGTAFCVRLPVGTERISIDVAEAG
ncbi:MAG: ATP-binding protein [Polyangiaceae bacterium]